MKSYLYPLALSLCLTPALAQDAAPVPSGEVQDGFSLMEEGARLLLKGLMSSMEPAMEDMGHALSEMEPALRDLMAMMGDIGNYHAPEKLGNGDIIIRRKQPSELPPAGPEIDL